MSDPRTVLAFDYGTRRIGVAVGTTITRTARALTTIAEGTEDARLGAIGRLVAEWQPDALVVGLPVHADGTPHAMTARAESFGRTLAQRFALPVQFADERHTTQAARAALAGRGRSGRALRDEVAAQIILQAWLDDATNS